MLALTGLCCEYAVNPLGIDAVQPRLSWVLEAAGAQAVARGLRQTAYQVLAATSRERLDGNNPDLWDSGKVDSSAVLVEWGGRALGSGQRCWWK
ncbi:MAG: hypothetical protein EHM21_09685, partial [Chloroflexi bacterium]